MINNFICPKTNIIISILYDGTIIRYLDGKILTKNINNYGYHYITLINKGIRKNYLVHKLVALIHLSNKENKPCINHINGIKTDNNADNLEWCTYTENMKHAVKIGLCTNSSRKGENHNTSKHSFSKVEEIRITYKTGNYSMREVAKIFGVSAGYVSDVINNKIRIEV